MLKERMFLPLCFYFYNGEKSGGTLLDSPFRFIIINIIININIIIHVERLIQPWFLSSFLSFFLSSLCSDETLSRGVRDLERRFDT